jgi:hypothetical protein
MNYFKRFYTALASRGNFSWVLCGKYPSVCPHVKVKGKVPVLN